MLLGQEVCHQGSTGSSSNDGHVHLIFIEDLSSCKEGVLVFWWVKKEGKLGRSRGQMASVAIIYLTKIGGSLENGMWNAKHDQTVGDFQPGRKHCLKTLLQILLEMQGYPGPIIPFPGILGSCSQEAALSPSSYLAEWDSPAAKTGDLWKIHLDAAHWYGLGKAFSGDICSDRCDKCIRNSPWLLLLGLHQRIKTDLQAVIWVICNSYVT